MSSRSGYTSKRWLSFKLVTHQSSKHLNRELWFQYLDMVGILLKLIRAERLGLWDLHLQSAVEMLPFLAASGHNLYVKSVWIYQQEMAKLQTSHPPIFEAFEQGGHTIRRSERRWSGLSADLVIEQEYMRSLKTSGGLKTGGWDDRTAESHLGSVKTSMPGDQPLDAKFDKNWLLDK